MQTQNLRGLLALSRSLDVYTIALLPLGDFGG